MFNYHDFDWFRYAEPDVNIKEEAQLDHFLLSPPSSPFVTHSPSLSSSASPPSTSLSRRRSSRLASPKRHRPYPAPRDINGTLCTEDINTMSGTSPYAYGSRGNNRGIERRSSDSDHPMYDHTGSDISDASYSAVGSTSYPTTSWSHPQQNVTPTASLYTGIPASLSFVSPQEGNYEGHVPRSASNSSFLNYDLYDSTTRYPPQPSPTSYSPDSGDLHYRIAELEDRHKQDKERIRILEAQLSNLTSYSPPGSAGITPPPSGSFQASWKARTEARKKQFCSPNRAGNALCAWHDTRRERRAYPPRMAPKGYLNCGCSYEEALFEESLARNGVGSYLPGDNVRMDPALRNPLLKLMQRRFGYKDGDFERDSRTGEWLPNEGHMRWEQESNSGKRPRNERQR